MSINLQTLTKDEDIGSIIEKLNSNFSQISTLGGGPQGLRGKQGFPGLPGLRGLSGPNGQRGNDGVVVQFIESDTNWGVLYQGESNQNIDASNAINQGYNVGDIWIDNANGIFYEINETSPGIFEFVPRPISPAALSSGEFWVSDTNSNRNADGSNKGVRNANRFVSFSITSAQKLPFTDPGDTEEYDENDNNFSKIGGYNRSAFKLSIDQNRSLDRVNTPFSVNAFLEKEFSDFSPVLYLGSSDNPESSLGFLHGFFSSGAGDSRVLLLSGNDGSSVDSTFAIDTDFIGVESKHLYFSSSNNSSINMLNPSSPVDSEFWVSYSVNTGDIPVGINSISNTFGVRLFSDNTNDRGNIEFYTSSDIDADSPEHTMTINGERKVNIGDIPSNILESRFSVIAKDTEENKLAWFLNNPSINNYHTGIGITQTDTGFEHPMIYAESGLSGIKTPRPLIIQPDGQFKNDWDSFTSEQKNDGQYAGVGIGYNRPRSRVSIDGNVAIGRNNLTAPDNGLVVSGNALFSETSNTTLTASAYPNSWPGNFESSQGVSFIQGEDNAKITIFQNFKSWNFITNQSNPGQGGLSTTNFIQDEAASRIILSRNDKKLVFGIESPNTQATFKGQDIVLCNGGNTVFGIPVNFPYLNSLDPKQRVTITKKNSTTTEGLQITDSQIGFEANRGFQFRTNQDADGQIFQGESKKISFHLNTIKRIEIDNLGRTTIRPTTPTINPFETINKGLTLRIQGDEHTSTYTQEVNVGAMNQSPITNMKPGSSYVGFNSFFDDTTNEVIFRKLSDDSTPGTGSGVFTFSDKDGGYHIACSYATLESGTIINTPN